MNFRVDETFAFQIFNFQLSIFLKIFQNFVQKSAIFSCGKRFLLCPGTQILLSMSWNLPISEIAFSEPQEKRFV
eukprot:UN19625